MKMSGMLRASGHTFLTTVAMTVVSFVSSVVTARILGPEGRGLLSAGLMIGTLAANVAQFGLAHSFVYHSGAARRFRYLRFYVSSLLFVAATAALFAWLGLQLSSDRQIHEYAGLVIAFAVCMGLQVYFFVLSQLHSDLVFLNVLRFGLVFGNLIFLVLILLFIEPVEFQQILASQVLVALILAVMGIVWARKHAVWRMADAVEQTSTRLMLRYGLHHYSTAVLGIVLINFDKLFLLSRATIEQFGYYTLAFTTSRLIGAVQEAMSTALYSRFAGRDTNHLADRVRLVTRLTFVPLLVMAGVGAVLSPWLCVLLYGPSFEPMAIPFALLLIECVITGACRVLDQRFNAAGRPGSVALRQLASALPMFALLPFLPASDTYIYLAGLMLFGAVLRLVITLLLYSRSLAEPTPSLLITLDDIRMVMRVFSKPVPPPVEASVKADS